MTGEHDNEFRDLDLKIAKALQIDVPALKMPELPAIEADNVATLPVRKRSRTLLWYALAASVVLAVSITIRTNDLFRSYDSLPDEVLAHLDHEPWALQVTDEAVSDERLARAIPASLASYERGAELITYAQPCIINGNTVPHLVVQGQYGPVTILLMPEERIAGALPLDGETVKGVIIPFGKGSIAFIGSREEPLESIQEKVINSVTWTT
ncbi:MAG: DUF3379 domain-containing protein [Gammaproteobacteria bacterium]|nr:DUF3379 domain-containing protein [Gammaproteobacteria bacterium]